MYKRSLNESSYPSAIGSGYPNKRQQQQQLHQLINMSSESATPRPSKTPKSSIVRILGRDYPLTATAYKRLIIGIRIGMDSCCIEIAIADNKGSDLSFSMYTWKLLLQNEADIHQRLRSNATSPETNIVIDHLRLEFTRMHDDQLIKITDNSSVIYMTEATMRKLLAYEHCIDHIFTWLTENMYSVSSKYATFVDVLHNTTAPTNYVKLISESGHIEQHSLVDCELLALGMQSMLLYVNHVPLQGVPKITQSNVEVAEEVEALERNGEESPETNSAAAEASTDVNENGEAVTDLDIEPSRRKTSNDTSTPAPKRRRSISNAILEILERNMAERQKLLHNITRASEQDSDPISLFFKSMAATVKNFRPDFILEAKAAVFHIINEIELKSLQAAGASTSNITSAP
ncbi:uncharacterized protein LOC143366364 [Andrena cerasifolii]|uniref:uncharacterized protein LOC143366364 n=1 Tax=Andrena cerasifolii TaxID=2819439 RepID=UPI004037ABC1